MPSKGGAGYHRAKSSTSAASSSSSQHEPFTKWDKHRDEIEVDYRQLDNESVTSAGARYRAGVGGGESCFSGRKGCVLKLLLVLTPFGVGVIVGFVIHRNVHHHHHAPQHQAHASSHDDVTVSSTSSHCLYNMNIHVKCDSCNARPTAVMCSTVLCRIIDASSRC